MTVECLSLTNIAQFLQPLLSGHLGRSLRCPPNRDFTVTFQYPAIHSYGTENLRTGKQSCFKLLFTYYPCWSVWDLFHLLSYADIYLLYRGKCYVRAYDCVRYNEDFVKSRLCSIHFTVIWAGLKKIVRYIEDFII